MHGHGAGMRLRMPPDVQLLDAGPFQGAVDAEDGAFAEAEGAAEEVMRMWAAVARERAEAFALNFRAASRGAEGGAAGAADGSEAMVGSAGGAELAAPCS